MAGKYIVNFCIFSIYHLYIFTSTFNLMLAKVHLHLFIDTDVQASLFILDFIQSLV